MYDIDIVYVIFTHLGAVTCCPLGKCVEMVYSMMLPLMTLTLLSVYCLFYYVVWFEFMPINVTFVYQFLPLDSENN